MTSHDGVAELMISRLSQGENLDLVYANPENHIVCLIPTYENGADSTLCYYVDGRQVLIDKPIRLVTRELALKEGLRPGCMLSSDGHRSAYTAPRIFGPHMTLAHIKCRRSIGKDVVYGLFNVAIPYEYRVEEGPQLDTSYIRVGNFEPILVYQSPAQVRRKLAEAMMEHCHYVRKMMARIKMSGNPYVVAELFIAWRDLTT